MDMTDDDGMDADETPRDRTWRVRSFPVGLLRALAALTFVLVVAPLFADTGMSGFAVPVVILGFGFALARHEVLTDRWRIKDEELAAWLEPALPSPGPDRRGR